MLTPAIVELLRIKTDSKRLAKRVKPNRVTLSRRLLKQLNCADNILFYIFPGNQRVGIFILGTQMAQF